MTDGQREAGRLAEYWDSAIAEWAERRPSLLWRAHSDAVNASLLERWLPAGRLRHVLKTDLFDEAVADGLYPVLSGRADRVTGIDVSPKIAGAARSRYPALETVVADVLALPFAESTFDAVVSLSTLDHFDSPDKIRAALLELHRVLAPGGTLIVTLDNAVNPAVAVRNRLPYPLLHKLGMVPYQVGVTRAPRRFDALLRAAGFDVADSQFVLHCPRMLAVGTARALERFGRGAAQFLRALRWFERLDRWPTRSLTGYYIAARALKRS